jgi:hypothetical protein
MIPASHGAAALGIGRSRFVLLNKGYVQAL